ncbi:MAG: dipeptidase [Tumebacillaceae bacterium]
MANNKLTLIDAHADILWRMNSEGLDFWAAPAEGGLHLSHERIHKAGVDMQMFVLWAGGNRKTPDEQLTFTLEMIDDFYEIVCKTGTIRPVLKRGDFARNLADGVVSGMLSIEGGDCLNGDIRVLRMMYKLGVRAMGLTWNHSNCIADGVLAPTDNGLTEFGSDVIREMNRLGMVVDVSHLAEKGFWDVMELAQAPVIASHANARAIHDHVRNLTDEQIQALFKTGGVIGLTYVPMFIGDGDVYISDILRHADHILSLGGEDHLGLGSDFDGIERTVVDLRHGEDYPRLVEALVKAYGDDVARKICGGNFRRVFESVLEE